MGIAAIRAAVPTSPSERSVPQASPAVRAVRPFFPMVI